MSAPDFKFKIIITGMESVGKTSLIRRFVDDKFEECYIPTILSDFTTKEVSVEGGKVRLLLYELAGHRKYAAHQLRHFQMADHICVVSSFDARRSLERIPAIIKRSLDAWRYANREPSPVPMTAIVNKLDLVRDHPDAGAIIRRFQRALGQMLSKEPASLECDRLLTSAKTGEGVDRLFYSVAARTLLSKRGEMATRQA
jgi:small GTP-binding protein